MTDSVRAETIPSPPRNLVVFFDGTNNQIKSNTDVDGTNVLRLYKAMAEHTGNRQFATYIPGVGTIPSEKMRTGPGKRVRAAIDKAIGTGLKDDVADGYRYLMKHYRPGDQIFLIGFSRGAYSARALAALVDNFGLVEGARESLIPYAMEYFWRGNRRKRYETSDYANVAARFKRNFSQDVPIQCIGVWDTVSAMGVFAYMHKLKGTDTLPNVKFAFQAVSIDERRTEFPPYHWPPEIEAATHEKYHTDRDWVESLDREPATVATSGDEELRVRLGWWTVWFPGFHSDVGGSPEDHRLADISLRWMASMVERAGLEIVWGGSEGIPAFDASAPEGKVYDYWNPLWGPFKAREIPLNALVHHSARAKLVMDSEYAKLHTRRRFSLRRKPTPLRQWMDANSSSPGDVHDSIGAAAFRGQDRTTHTDLRMSYRSIGTEVEGKMDTYFVPDEND